MAFIFGLLRKGRKGNKGIRAINKVDQVTKCSGREAKISKFDCVTKAEYVTKDE